MANAYDYQKKLFYMDIIWGEMKAIGWIIRFTLTSYGMHGMRQTEAK